MLYFARKELSDWNKQHPEEALPRIVLVIDEFAELTIASGPLVRKEVLNLVTRICNLGRAVGIHLIVATQRPAVQVVPNDIKIDMPLVISGQVQNGEQSKVILGVGNAAELPDIPGRMIFSLGAKLRTIQTPFISDDDVAQAIHAAKRWGEGVAALVKAEGAEADAVEEETAAPVQAEPEQTMLKVVITNSIEEWINERCEWGSYVRSCPADLYRDYCHWCTEHQRPPDSQKALGGYLSDRGAIPKKNAGGRYWLGIALKPNGTLGTDGAVGANNPPPLTDFVEPDMELEEAAR